MTPRVLIITGYGLNCEAESKYAWEQAGAETELIHLNDLLAQPARLHEFQSLMFIGGFSYGDHMGSGLVFALRVKHHLREHLARFIADGKLVLGVCNGFQIITKMGLLPGLDGEYFQQTLALMQNDCGTYQDFWIHLRFDPDSPCVFTRGLDTMTLPIRHGEGKLFTRDKKLLERIEALRGVPCRYVDPATGEPSMKHPHNPNGSLNAMAGLCDPTGRVFGLMPHPEAFIFPENHPHWDLHRLRGEPPERGDGLKIFENGVRYLRERL
ncbi:MAG: phosphoribosylformylglycinamidine synthase subunit PurQ [bacterium]